MATYMDDGAHRTRKLTIASVPKNKFDDELAEPSYSRQHFFVHRELSCTRLIFGLMIAVLFPLVVMVQTLIYVFYCEDTNCCFKWLPEDVDWTDPQATFLYDFFGAVIGRDPRDRDPRTDLRAWFLKQTLCQKVARCAFSGLVILVFFGAWFNAINLGVGWFNENESDEASDQGLAVVETMGPLQVWFGLCIILAVYMALDIDVTPQPPSMQALRPYVMYLNAEESIRTTAYVFLRGFAKSTLNIFRLEATRERIITSLVASIVYVLIPGVVRVYYQTEGGGRFFPKDYALSAILAILVNFVVVFALILGLQMQLLSGLLKYIEWMDDITSMLDQVFSAQKELHYISLTRHNNMLAWLEMRSYLHTKGLVIFSRQEIFVVYLIVLEILFALYILYRLITTAGQDKESQLSDTLGSPSFMAFVYFFCLCTYGLIRILRTTRRIESLQTKQISLLAAQKFQIYYKRITWHPEDEQDEHDDETFSEVDDFEKVSPELDPLIPKNDDNDSDFGDVPLANDPVEESESDDFGNAPEAADPVEEDTDSEEVKNDGIAGTGRTSSKEKELKISQRIENSPQENHALLSKENNPDTLAMLPVSSVSGAEVTTTLKGGKQEGGRSMRLSGPSIGRPSGRHRRTQSLHMKYNDMAESGQQLFSADYLEQSEKFVLAAMNICEAQDIIPRVFNVQINSAVGLSILCTTFAVIPTVIRLAFGDDCDAWQA